MKKRNVIRNRVNYTMTYDEYDSLDTVTKTGDAELLSTKNKDVKFLSNNADAILNYRNVSGLTYQ